MKKFLKIAIVVGLALACLAIGTGDDEEFEAEIEPEAEPEAQADGPAGGKPQGFYAPVKA